MAGGMRASALTLGLVAVALGVVALVAHSAASSTSLLQFVVARPRMLSWLTEGTDPVWVEKGELPLDYFMKQSPLPQGLEFWPGAGDPRPGEPLRPEPVEAPKWLGNGYGLIINNGQPVLKKGFMGPNCSADGQCQNLDICVRGRCIPSINNGTEVVMNKAKKTFPRDVVFASKYQALAQQLRAMKEAQAERVQEAERLRSLYQHRNQIAGLYNRQVALDQRQAEFQQLAMGGGTPVDLNFGVGKDGEPPYHLNTYAESVRNGVLDPNAPEVLPYTRVTGSGTSGQIASVGYLNKIAGADEGDLEGTVA